MIVESVRMVATALADPTNGVNAQITAIGSASGWGTDTAPPNVASIVTPYGDHYAAVGDAPESLPALSVVLIGIEQLEPYGAVGIARDADLTVAVRYDGLDDDPRDLWLRGSQTMRAVLRSLSWFCRDAASAARVNGGVQFIQAHRLVIGEVESGQESNPITVAAFLTANVRDAI